jgi:hypothetical protein
VVVVSTVTITMTPTMTQIMTRTIFLLRNSLLSCRTRRSQSTLFQPILHPVALWPFTQMVSFLESLFPVFAPFRFPHLGHLDLMVHLVHSTCPFLKLLQPGASFLMQLPQILLLLSSRLRSCHHFEQNRLRFHKQRKGNKPQPRQTTTTCFPQQREQLSFLHFWQQERRNGHNSQQDQVLLTGTDANGSLLTCLDTVSMWLASFALSILYLDSYQKYCRAVANMTTAVARVTRELPIGVSPI